MVGVPNTKKGPEAPFWYLGVRPADENIVRQNTIVFWTPEAPRRGEPAGAITHLAPASSNVLYGFRWMLLIRQATACFINSMLIASNVSTGCYI